MYQTTTSNTYLQSYIKFIYLVFEFILQPGFTTYVIIRKIIFKNGRWEYALKFIHKIVVERDLLI